MVDDDNKGRKSFFNSLESVPLRRIFLFIDMKVNMFGWKYQILIHCEIVEKYKRQTAREPHNNSLSASKIEINDTVSLDDQLFEHLHDFKSEIIFICMHNIAT